MKNKKFTYIILASETMMAMFIGIMSCVDGQTNLYQTLAIGMIIISICGIANMFRLNNRESKINILDFFVSIAVIVLNRQFLGLIFGWEQCPLI